MEWPLGQFNFNSDVVCRTSSHIWGKWYLPMFLFRDGSLTLMNRASLIALVRFWPSLPTIVKSLMLMLWPEMLQLSNIGEGAFWCSLNLSAKFLADSPIYSSLHPCWLHLNLYMTPLLFVIGSLSLGAMRRFLIVWPPLKNTCEETREDGSMPFLDILVTPEDDGSLKTSVFRKTTHADLYLQWDRHHTIPSKYSVAGTLFHRASTVCSTPQLLQEEEEEHLFRALTRYKYPTWAIKRARMRSQNSNNIRTRRTNQTGQKNKTNLYMVVPYHQGLSERIKRSCNKFGVQVFFKGGQIIRNLLMAPKDKDPITNKSGVIYRFKCSQHGCKEEYIGESARNFAERFKEHQKAPSPIFDHCNISGHNININNFTIVGREGQNLTRAIKEALFIRVNDPSLNRNIGKYHLPHIWDEVLHSTSELKLNWPSGHSIKPPWQ